MKGFVGVLLVLLGACASDPAPPSPLTTAPTATTGAGAGETPKVDTMLGQVPGVKFVGDWTSTGCPGRAYARNLTFFDNGEYAGTDLVSPCPPGATCVWSGIVAFAGVWKQEGTKLLLREIGAPTQPGSPHPTEVVATYDGKLVENDCMYTSGLTVPPGYTEDQVRPRVPGSK